MSDKIVLLFDMRRFIDAKRSSEPDKGITKYARILIEGFYKSDCIDVIPVLVINSTIKVIDDNKVLRQLISNSPIVDNFSSRIFKTIMNNAKKYKIRNPFIKHLKKSIENKGSYAFMDSLRLKDINDINYKKYIYFSPVNELPDKSITKNCIRLLTIHDCIYVVRPEFYPIPGRTPPIKRALDIME